jgi:hypothetical protein
MLVSEIDLHKCAELSRVAARVSFEESDRPGFDLFAETQASFRRAFKPDPNALLLACLLPAWRAGERRILVDGPLCPVLVRDIFAALRTLACWYPELGQWPSIESTRYETKQAIPGPCVSLLSCGVDSLATLRQNSLCLPSDHPLRIAVAIPVVFCKSPAEGINQLDGGRLPSARNVTADLGIEMCPVWTNLWWLVDHGSFFDLIWHGALYAFVASLFSGAYSGAYIAASFDGRQLFKPWGSSPLLDPYYSSSHFRIQHHGSNMSRLEKTALVANWPAGLNNLRVCQRDWDGTANCGGCEKCIRVMTTLVALGKQPHLHFSYPAGSQMGPIYRLRATRPQPLLQFSARWHRHYRAAPSAPIYMASIYFGRCKPTFNGSGLPSSRFNCRSLYGMPFSG